VYAVGIDLAWSPRNPSGLAIAERSRGRWILSDVLAGLRSNEEIVGWMERGIGARPAIAAIDAPLVVPYERRGREGDRLVTRLFGPMEAGVYPATRRGLRRYGGDRIWSLVHALEAHGYRHDCRIVPRRKTRQVFETYPHAAMVALFGLRRTLKYKTRQGRTYATRWRAIRDFEAHLRSLEHFVPGLIGVDEVFERDSRLRGGKLKDYEDRLDAIVCAYVAAYYWTWGTRRCAIMGTLEGGYIVTPMTPAIADRAPDASPVFAYDGDRSVRPGRRGP